MFKPFLQITLAAALSASAFVSQASAAEYKSVDTAASSLTFNYSQMSVKMDGKIAQFNVPAFSFDPAQLEQAKLRIEVPATAIDAGSGEANTELAKDDWLSIANHALASFEATSVKKIDEQNYEISGQLNIKGQAQEVKVPATFSEQAQEAKFSGVLTINRADFGIGQGMWADTSIIANEIQINFDLIAKP